jgi:hypothetical protein
VSAGASEVEDDDDLFIIMAPQNAVANCLIPVRGLRLAPVEISGSIDCVLSKHFSMVVLMRSRLLPAWHDSMRFSHPVL